jgi:hypothetical protein
VKRQQLIEYVEQLNSYLTDIEVTDQEREALQALIVNIDSQLGGEASEPSDTLGQQVDELASAFEAEHPTLTGVLNNIMVTLTSMGV